MLNKNNIIAIIIKKFETFSFFILSPLSIFLQYITKFLFCTHICTLIFGYNNYGDENEKIKN